MENVGIEPFQPYGGWQGGAIVYAGPPGNGTNVNINPGPHGNLNNVNIKPAPNMGPAIPPGVQRRSSDQSESEISIRLHDSREGSRRNSEDSGRIGRQSSEESSRKSSLPS